MDDQLQDQLQTQFLGDELVQLLQSHTYLSGTGLDYF